MPMDAWDGDTDKMSAQDFLRASTRRRRLVPGAPRATKLDMDLIDIALEAQYPAEPKVQPTAAEFATELLRCKLTKEELARRSKWPTARYGRTTLGHEDAASRAQGRGFSNDNVYRASTGGAPGSPAHKDRKTHVNWPAFIKAVRDVDTVELELDMKEEKESRKRRALAHNCTRSESVSKAREEEAKATSYDSTSPQQQQAPRAPYQPQAPRAPYQPATQQQPLDEAQRRILIDAIARIVHHPDMEAGRRAHVDQQQEWTCPRELRRMLLMRDDGTYKLPAPWRRIVAQALKEVPVAVRMVGYSPWDVDDYGRPFGDDTARFEEARTAPEEQGKAKRVLECEEPSPEDSSPGPQVRSNTSTPMYAPSESHIVDLYTVGIERRPRRTSVPFICGIELEGPRGELVRVQALEDDGAMVSAMCTALYERERHRIGELKHSGKTLRMANGTLIPSMGFWEGYIRFGGARPLLEEFEAVHDYKMDSITVPGEDGLTVVENQIGRLGQWDEARGRVHAVFLDPKSRATSTGGSSAPPVRRVLFFDHRTPKNVDGQWCETKSAMREGKPTTGVPQAAQGNSMGDLPSPSREVQGVEEGERGSITDDITLTAWEPENDSKMEDMTEGPARETEMENSEDTRVYIPGDFSRSPLRGVPEKTQAFRSTSDTDSTLWAGSATGVPQALQMAGLVLIWGILVLAAQYGGDGSKTSTRGTPSGDLESPPREVPAPESVLEKVLVTDTAMPVIYLNKNWRTRRRYTKSENEKRMKYGGSGRGSGE
ncbi:hypothetical protein B0H13DRAFT_2350282 [Mycena leptocephala]|nr:hypothetical protein B0H13DRAFT_2350282 [Mycena leptocephala]